MSPARHVALIDPKVGSEIQKTRPCVLVAPNDLNEAESRAEHINPALRLSPGAEYGSIWS